MARIGKQTDLPPNHENNCEKKKNTKFKYLKIYILQCGEKTTIVHATKPVN